MTPNDPLTSQLGLRPTYHLPAEHLFSDAPKSLWSSKDEHPGSSHLDAPSPILSSRPEISFPSHTSTVSGPQALSILLPKILDFPLSCSRRQNYCFALVWVSTLVSTLAGALPDPLGTSHVGCAHLPKACPWGCSVLPPPGQAGIAREVTSLLLRAPLAKC